METENRTAEVNRKPEDRVLKPWQPPVVEELLVSEAENTLTFGGPDNTIYTS